MCRIETTFSFLCVLGGWVLQSVLCESIVHLKSGIVSGSLYQGHFGNVTQFLGIQYGEAPVGKRRFQLPVPTAPWKGIHVANHDGPVCIQPKRYRNKIEYFNKTLMSEDCLFLNVYIPEYNFESQNKGKLPVLVFLSGHFPKGARPLFDGSTLALRTHAIVVTINYRLGIFGFLSITNHIPGNFGLHDQALALHWVKGNIGNFGGDNDNIALLTSFNEAKILQTSDRFVGLFHKMIPYDDMLPSSVGPIGTSDDLLQSKLLLSHCTGIDLLECLQSLSTYIIEDIAFDTDSSWQENLFQPVIDEVIVTDLPDTLIQKGNFEYVDQIVLNQYPSSSLPAVNLHNCSMRTLSSTIHHIETFLHHRMNANQKLALQTFFIPTMDTPDGYCLQVKSLLRDFYEFNLIRNLNDRNNYALTFLVLYSTNDSQRTNDSQHIGTMSDIACTLTANLVDKCDVDLEDKIVSILQTFLYHGYPSTNDSAIFRPYTTHSKNHITLNGGKTKAGNAQSWPFMKTEMLWNRLLPSLRRNTSEFKCAQHTTGSVDWGMTEEQVEALVYSLVLTCLFLLVWSLTLLRIICHVKGKPFLIPRQMSPLKNTFIGTDVSERKYHKSNHNGRSKISSVCNSTQTSELHLEENCSSVL